MSRDPWRGETLAGTRVSITSRCGSERVILKNCFEFVNFVQVLMKHFPELAVVQAGGGMMWAPSSGGVFEPHTIPHAILRQHLLSVCTLDLTSTVMTYMHIHPCVMHSPLSGSSVNESCAQNTEQIHGKHNH